MAGDELAENGAEVGGDGEVAALVKLVGAKPGPLAVDAAPCNAAAEGEHHVGMAMVGTAVAILSGRPAEFGESHHGDVLETIAEILPEGGERAPKLAEEKCELGSFVDVRIPTTHVRESDLEADVGFDQPGNLLRL